MNTIPAITEDEVQIKVTVSDFLLTSEVFKHF